MKGKLKPAGIIALAAVIGFLMAACDYQVTEAEAVTDGRLTITGLDYYESVSVFASNKEYSLEGYKSAKNMYNKADNTSWLYSCTLAEVVSGEAVLKVFVDKGNQVGEFWNGMGGFQNYNGNDKNVVFKIGVQETRDVNWIGTVTVNFTRGIGGGVFVPIP